MDFSLLLTLIVALMQDTAALLAAAINNPTVDSLQPLQQKVLQDAQAIATFVPLGPPPPPMPPLPLSQTTVTAVNTAEMDDETKAVHANAAKWQNFAPPNVSA